jgi:hypothetical protein
MIWLLASPSFPLTSLLSSHLCYYIYVYISIIFRYFFSLIPLIVPSFLLTSFSSSHLSYSHLSLIFSSFLITSFSSSYLFYSTHILSCSHHSYSHLFLIFSFFLLTSFSSSYLSYHISLIISSFLLTSLSHIFIILLPLLCVCIKPYYICYPPHSFFTSKLGLLSISPLLLSCLFTALLNYPIFPAPHLFLQRQWQWRRAFADPTLDQYGKYSWAPKLVSLVL